MTPSIAEILKEHVTFELESIDRFYLNGYVPGLQTPAAVTYFLRQHRGAKFASSVLLDQISRDYEKRIGRFVREEGIAVHRFTKGERKDDETQRRLRTFTAFEGGSTSAPRRRSSPPCAPRSAAIRRPGGLSRGWSAPRSWRRSTIGMSSMRISAPCSSSLAVTFRIR